MNARLEAIARRRATVVSEIGRERERMAAAFAGLGTRLALAGLALLAARLVRRSRWSRLLAAGATVLSVALPLATRMLSGRR